MYRVADPGVKLIRKIAYASTVDRSLASKLWGGRSALSAPSRGLRSVPNLYLNDDLPGGIVIDGSSRDEMRFALSADLYSRSGRAAAGFQITDRLAVQNVQIV